MNGKPQNKERNSNTAAPDNLRQTFNNKEKYVTRSQVQKRNSEEFDEKGSDEGSNVSPRKIHKLIKDNMFLTDYMWDFITIRSDETFICENCKKEDKNIDDYDTVDEDIRFGENLWNHIKTKHHRNCTMVDPSYTCLNFSPTSYTSDPQCSSVLRQVKILNLLVGAEF